MLTKQDLQNIRGLIREEINGSVPAILQKEIRGSVPAIVQDEIRASVPAIVQEELAPITKEIKQIKTKLNRVAKDVRYIAKDFDERITANTRAIQKLQNN